MLYRLSLSLSLRLSLSEYNIALRLTQTNNAVWWWCEIIALRIGLPQVASETREGAACKANVHSFSNALTALNVVKHFCGAWKSAVVNQRQIILWILCQNPLFKTCRFSRTAMPVAAATGSVNAPNG